MSNQAKRWLANIPAGQLKHTEFRVLFSLCDCHHTKNGCFPTQEHLMAKSGVKNGTLNAALKSLENKSFIERRKRWNPTTHKQMSTLYILRLDHAAEANMDATKPAAAVSKYTAEPSPKREGCCLQQAGDNNKTNKKNNHTKLPFFTEQEKMEAREVALYFKKTGSVKWEHVKQRVRECITSNQMLPADVLQQEKLR